MAMYANPVNEVLLRAFEYRRQRRRLRPIGGLGNGRQCGLSKTRRKPVEVLKAHDERAPAVRIDAVGLAGHEDGAVGVHAHNLDFKRDQIAACGRVVLRQAVRAGQPRLQLDRALGSAV